MPPQKVTLGVFMIYPIAWPAYAHGSTPTKYKLGSSSLHWCAIWHLSRHVRNQYTIMAGRSNFTRNQ